MSLTPPSPEALRAAAAALCADPRLLALLQRLSDGQARSARLAPGDADLLQALRQTADPRAAVSQSLNQALQWHAAARQVLRAASQPAPRRQQWLELASGSAWLARFVDAQDPALALTTCAADASAREFATQAFGIRPLALPDQPQALAPGGPFDGVWAPAFFAGLPAAQWRPWLARLLGLLGPGGRLCLSVPQAQDDVQLVRTVREAIGPAPTWQRIACGLSSGWDLAVISQPAAGQPQAACTLDPGPSGSVDELRVAQGRLRIQGWAAVPADGTPAWVQVRLDGQEHRCPTGLHRPDVAAFLGDARQSHCGWCLDLALDPAVTAPWIEITAHGAKGGVALLHAGPLAQPLPPPPSAHVYHREIAVDSRSTLSVLASLVPAGSQVLDLGTGSGVLGRHLNESQDCTVDGVTLSAEEQASARAWYRQLDRLDLEDRAWPQVFAGRQYDCIVCADVLEHLREPEAVLQACAGLLQPGGRLLVSIPNVAYAGMSVSLMHGNWNYGREGLLDRTHLRFFTRRSFTQLLQAEGWQVDRIEAIEMAWFLTEFWTPFDHLPPAVARYLLAQPDASAYQLVFAAQRADAAAHSIAAQVPAPDPTVNIAVFAATLYAGAGPAGPLQSARALGRIGLHRQRLRFALAAGLPADAVLRLDPADRPGLLHLHALTLRGPQNQVLWQWRAARDGLPALAAGRRHQMALAPAEAGADHLLCHLQGDDAQIDLPLPAHALAGPGPWALEVDCGWPLSADYLALQAGLPQVDEATVEIVLPVYGGLEVLKRCMASVLAAVCRQPWHLTVIDDASPQAEVGLWLDELARAQPQITVLRNARNQGFVRTVNLGMRLAGRRDVVLLNSDTEVAGDWLDRLHRAAYGAPRIGTVTPFSNNATICSHPRFCEDNPLPAGQTVTSLDRLFAQANAGRSVAIPTGVGFCMYIRRACLDAVGEFDAQTFGTGYGEENDFCVRASAAGWQHLHALDVFVFHAGAVSFSESRHALQQTALEAIRRLHPHYEDMVRDFVQRDPARPFREAVLALAARSAPGADQART